VAATNELHSVDVAVIGAGMSGLAVADGLIRAGLSVRVLEARDRIGGRLQGSPLDRGASWHWPGEHRVRAMAQRCGVEIFEQYRLGDALIDDTSGVHRYPGNPIDVPAYRIVGGTFALASALTAQLPPGTIHLGQPVHDISSDLHIASRDHRWRAHHVVIALPPALAVHAIALPREFPAGLIDVAARTPVWMGDSVKVVAHFSAPFWRHDGLAGAALSRRGPLIEIHDMSGPDGEPAALFGFARAASMHADIETDVRAQLIRMFGPQASEPIDILIQDWSREEWTTPPVAAELPDCAMFGHPLYQQPVLDGRLHWSSTETAGSYAGHIEGALAAAERTVASIVSTTATGALS
jgi:monoamine oxidase